MNNNNQNQNQSQNHNVVVEGYVVEGAGSTATATATTAPVRVLQGVPIPPGEDIGICRSCGREFVRPPGTHDGVAQFYRCGHCDHITFQTLVDNWICRIS